MLERFKPKPEDSERVSLDSLYEVVTAIFEKMGVQHLWQALSKERAANAGPQPSVHDIDCATVNT